MNLLILLLAAMVGGGIEPTTPAPATRPKVAGIVCTCGKKIPFSWSTKLIQGENGDTLEIECFGCGAVWHISQERMGAGKPLEPERRVPIHIDRHEDGTIREVLYRGKPAKLGTDYTLG